MDKKQALGKAVHVLGGQSALARVCGPKIKQQHVYNWLNRDGGLPAQHAMKVFRATHDKGDPVFPWQLCPDAFSRDDFAVEMRRASA